MVVTLAADAAGTQVSLAHYGLPAGALREAHRVAWQTYLGRLVVRGAGGDPGPEPHG